MSHYTSPDQVRLVARLVHESQFELIRATSQIVGGRIERAVVMLLALRLDLTTTDEAESPDRAPSLRALAASVKRNPETFRRHILKLQKEGILDQSARSNPMPRIAERSVSRALKNAARASFLNLVRRIERLDAWRRDYRDLDRCSRQLIEVAAIDLALSLFETAQAQGWSWNEFFTVSTVVLMNARPFTFDTTKATESADRYYEIPTGWRQPVSIQEVSLALGRPYSTISKHLRKALRDTVLIASPTGVVVNEHFMHSPEALCTQRDVVATFHRKLAQMPRISA